MIKLKSTHHMSDPAVKIANCDNKHPAIEVNFNVNYNHMKINSISTLTYILFQYIPYKLFRNNNRCCHSSVYLNWPDWSLILLKTVSVIMFTVRWWWRWMWRLEGRERWCEGEWGQWGHRAVRAVRAEGYKRVGRKGGERSLMMETTAHIILLLCCIGIIQTNMMPDGCLISQYCWTKCWLIKSH